MVGDRAREYRRLETDAHRVIMGSLLGRARSHVKGEAISAGRVVFGHCAKYRPAGRVLPNQAVRRSYPLG